MKKKDATKKVPTEVGTLAQLVLPLAELVRGDLQAFVVSVGIQAITAMLESERTELAGPRYQHDPDRRASRGGTTPGKLTLGGRQIRNVEGHVPKAKQASPCGGAAHDSRPRERKRPWVEPPSARRPPVARASQRRPPRRPRATLREVQMACALKDDLGIPRWKSE
jgi:hypothetical protein